MKNGEMCCHSLFSITLDVLANYTSGRDDGERERIIEYHLSRL